MDIHFPKSEKVALAVPGLSRRRPRVRVPSAPPERTAHCGTSTVRFFVQAVVPPQTAGREAAAQRPPAPAEQGGRPGKGRTDDRGALRHRRRCAVIPGPRPPPGRK